VQSTLNGAVNLRRSTSAIAKAKLKGATILRKLVVYRAHPSTACGISICMDATIPSRTSFRMLIKLFKTLRESFSLKNLAEH
jgi:hypothetical protein